MLSLINHVLHINVSGNCPHSASAQYEQKRAILGKLWSVQR